MAEPAGQSRKLTEVFDDVWKIYEFLERCDDPTPSPKVQKEVVTAITEGERAVHMINALELFSDNENVEEVATNELRYLVMPALLAYFTSKSAQEERLNAIKKSQVYYADYLRLIKSYGVADVEVPKLGKEEEERKTVQSQPTRPGMPDLALMERQRKDKIARYKEQKTMENRLKELEKAAKLPTTDDEIKREYYLTLLKSWASRTQDELESFKMELPILEHMAKMKEQTSNGTPEPKPERKPEKKRAPMQPFILTKDKLQAQVFGMGYPSIPTYSVEDWADMQIAAGRMPDMGTAQNTPPTKEEEEEEAARKEEAEERDDEEGLRKAREWDDWKDDHRRGWGNRQNMG